MNQEWHEAMTRQRGYLSGGDRADLQFGRLVRRSSLEVLTLEPETLAISFASDGVRQRLGIDLSAGVTRTLFNVAPALDRRAVFDLIGEIEHGRQTDTYLYTELRLPDGRSRSTELNFAWSPGARPAVLVLLSDPSGTHSAMEAAKVARTQLQVAMGALPDGFVLFDGNDRLVMCNERYREFFSNAVQDLRAGMSFEEIHRRGLEAGQFPQAIGREEEWLARRNASHDSGENDMELQVEGGRWIRLVERRTPDGGRVGLGIDITPLKVKEQELLMAAQSDPLTGLLNRRGLTEAMNEIELHGPEDERLAVMHIDLDKFKSVNDMLGHDAGDHVLSACSSILQRLTRDGDFCARVGGDEFVLVCRDVGIISELSEFARRLVHALSAPIPYSDKVCHVGASIGISIWVPDFIGSGERALQDADIALKFSKESGRGRHVFFRPEMRDAARISAEISHEIVEGLENGQFCIWLQPQLEISGARVTGFEALIRWQHPQRGLIGPDQFLDAAREANLMEALDSEVLRLSCAAAGRLATINGPDVRVSINLSTSRLSDPRLLETMNWHLQCHDLSPGNIVIEILESTLLDDRAANVVENVHRLSDSGFSVELDDFGTGHAAIGNLRRFRVDRVKIDRSLVDGIDRDDELRIITTSIIGLCQGLGIEVLCEGVQCEAERQVLEAAGCAGVQGFFFARPMPLEELELWLSARPEWKGANLQSA
ncbi:putative bifunctional diguanylate cyclase/phosphodiesterase [Pelagovum pacificum]|uniref:EAL domain-containing protein n=1 Tax=Pelagovum pacificum TaxID=2588711 RepID=A0A5C5GBD7_9RHOB|nr:EAL domain-containing protein [Pelagovum pacificum]QQA42184.1 EAL domain-containing protein [Pelagovum pacificum]TNY31270.1 EAL domain-containing protein [Pelagovum pacificum]